MGKSKARGDMNPKTQRRQSAILDLLMQQGRASVDEVADLLGMTPQTIRKDLAALASENKIVRFHGGASLLAGIEYSSFEARKNVATTQKAKIATACAAMIPNNVALLINSGTTTAAVAQALQDHNGLRIVTDSVMIANEIRAYQGVDVMVPGGRVRASDGAIMGHSAVEFITQFRPDFAIIGAAAIARDGALLDYDMAEVSVARAMIAKARNVILCAASSKFDQMAPVRITGLESVDTLVTDRDCSETLRNLCRTNGVRVIDA